MATFTRSSTSWPAFLTFRHLKEDLGLDRQQVFYLATRRNFPLVKRGRTYRIPRKALVWWLAQEADLTHMRDSTTQTRRQAGAVQDHDA